MQLSRLFIVLNFTILLPTCVGLLASNFRIIIVLSYKICYFAFPVKSIPTRCNNCGLFFANAFTLHVSGDNPTHHQEYMCCIWPQVSRHT